MFFLPGIEPDALFCSQANLLLCHSSDNTACVQKMLAAHPLQRVTINTRFCWLFMTFLTFDTFSRLSVLSERVDNGRVVLKIHCDRVFVFSNWHAGN